MGFGEVIAVGDDGVFGALADARGAVNFAGVFDFFFGFAFDALWVVGVTYFFGGVVAVFLEVKDLASETAEHPDGAGKFFGVGGELLASFGFEEELGELGGGELEADFGEFGGVVFCGGVR